MSKLSIAAVKRRLPPGQEFTAEFVGRNRRVARDGMAVCRRRVTRQGSQMVSSLLDGPRQGESIHLGWRGVTAEDVDGAIVLRDSDQSNGQAEPFLKITFDEPPGESDAKA